MLLLSVARKTAPQVVNEINQPARYTRNPFLLAPRSFFYLIPLPSQCASYTLLLLPSSRLASVVLRRESDLLPLESPDARPLGPLRLLGRPRRVQRCLRGLSGLWFGGGRGGCSCCCRRLLLRVPRGLRGRLGAARLPGVESRRGGTRCCRGVVVGGGDGAAAVAVALPPPFPSPAPAALSPIPAPSSSSSSSPSSPSLLFPFSPAPLPAPVGGPPAALLPLHRRPEGLQPVSVCWVSLKR